MRKGKRDSTKIIWSVYAVLVFLQPGAHAVELPLDSSNAALLYYQAFLLCPNPDDIPREAFRTVFPFRGSIEESGSVEEVRDYAEDYQHVIRLVETASEIPNCDWGISSLEGSKVWYKLKQQIKSLAFLVGADARVLAANGDYEAAFSRCLVLRRFARHLANDPSNPLMFNIPPDVDVNTLGCMRLILNMMPPDEKTLRWLKKQLAAEPPTSEPLSMLMKKDFEQTILSIRKGLIPSRLKEKLAEKANSKKLMKEVMNLTDEKLIELVRRPYAQFLDSVLNALASDIPYEQKYARMEELTQKFVKQSEDNPFIIMFVVGEAIKVPGVYSERIAHTAYVNAIKAAIEVYLLRATTGRLPEAFPNGLPKDPFSGEDFEYKMTKEGFALRCRAQDIKARMVRQYEFKVQRRMVK